jgi:hypothetical protein
MSLRATPAQALRSHPRAPDEGKPCLSGHRAQDVPSWPSLTAHPRGAVRACSGGSQARNEVALHGVSPIAWGCQNEAPVELGVYGICACYVH